MENDWNIDDSDFMEAINNLFSLKYWGNKLWKFLSVILYWIPPIGLIYALIVCLKKDYMHVSLFWIIYQLIVPILIEIFILQKY